MKKIFILSLIFILSKQLSAQTSLKGSITDHKNNSPLATVTVFIPELQKGTVSANDGTFTIETPSSGIVNVQFTMIGYKSQVKTVNLSESNSELKINMEPSATELEEVVVTSNNVKLPDNIPYSVNTVSKEELDNTAGLTMMSKLVYQPGIDRISVGSGIGKPVIRGNSFNRILLYSMGTRIENQQWDDRHDLGISEIGVDKVEVINGPSALIYGADALGGALIFVDEKPAAAGKCSGDASIGFNLNNLGSHAEVGYKGTNTKGLFYSIRAGGHGNGSYIQGGSVAPGSLEKENFAANSKFIDMGGKASIGLSKQWGVSKLSYSFFNQNTGIIELEDSAAVATEKEGEQKTYDVEAPYQDVTSHIVSLENTILTGKSKLNVNVAYQLNDRKEFEPNPDSGIPKDKRLATQLKLNTVTYDAKWSSNAEKKFGVTIGTQGSFLKNENGGEESLVPNAKVSDVAGYGLIRYDYDKINLLGGVRYDMRHIEATTYRTEATLTDSFIVMPTITSADTINPKPATDFKKDYKPVSFSFGAAFHPNESFTIKINGATGFSAPNYAELATFGRHEGTYRFERGDENLKVEQNVEGDIGFIWEHEFITLNLGGFYNKIKDYIYIVDTGETMMTITDAVDVFPLYQYRQGDASLAGGEAGFDIHPEDLKWLDIKADYSAVRGKLDGGGDLPFMPADKIVAELKLSSSKKLLLHEPYIAFVVSNYFKQEKVSEYELPTSGYTLLDAHLGGNFNIGKHKASLSIFGTNILNTAYYSHLSLIKYIGVREMGMNIGFALKVQFGR